MSGEPHVLEYQVYGKPGAPGVVYHHGTIGSARLPDNWAHDAEESGVQFIVPARPGYGASTPVAEKNLMFWPQVMEALLTDVFATRGIHRVAALGISGGAPYACVLAAADARIGRLWLLSAVPAITDTDVASALSTRESALWQHYAHTPTTALIEELCQFLHAFDTDSIEGIEPAEREWLGHALVETLAHDGLGGINDMQRIANDWGFDPFHHGFSTDAWHAVNDESVSFASAEAFYRKLHDVRLHRVEHGGHFITAETRAALFRQIQLWALEDED
ncbi:alpha/beta fold hydrolase [Solilutibacter pythonis]|uniref:alpha/beta fold hydrolase n=1 Tax=Solilutibacter pythonis TaxID=2483112 RepID=UPI0011C4343F|nr:alpha/beta hydrolase [Lysobacter pythonis]